MNERKSEANFASAIKDRLEKHRLVKEFFLDQVIDPKYSDPRAVAINAVVAVLSVPRDDLLERAAYIDKRTSRPMPSLVDNFSDTYSQKFEIYEDAEKAKKDALHELAVQMAKRVALTAIKSSGHDAYAAIILLPSVERAARIYY